MREVNGALSRRGWGGAGVQCGLCASSLRLRAGEESAVTGLGATRPASHSLLRPLPLLQPPPRARGRPRHPNSAAFPAHTPGTARPVPQPPARRGGVLPKEDGPRRSPSFPDACGGRAPAPPRGCRAARLAIPARVVLAWWLSSTRLGRRSQTAGTEGAAEAAQAGRARSPAPAPNPAPPARSGHPCLRRAAGSRRPRGWAAPPSPRVQGGRVGQETLLEERA